MQGSLHDEYNLYALLAYMSNYMDNIEGVPPPGDSNLYIHKALRASQNYVKSGQPITGRMIFNIFSLGCAEWYRYNREAAYVHLSAAKSMIDSIGGLETLDGPLVELLLTGDAYVAGELKKKPLWSDADFDNGDNHPMTAYGLQELQKLLSGEVPIGSGLLTSSQRDIISPGLRWVILDLAVVLSVLKTSQLPGSDDESRPSGGLHWVHIRSIAIRHRLLHMELDDPRSDAVRIAIVLWMFMCFTVTGRKRSIKVIAPFLREALLDLPDEEWEGHDDVQLWILIVGAVSADVGTEEHTWFVARINAWVSANAKTSDKLFAALVTLSDKFFYHEPAQKYDLRGLADDLEHMRRNKKKTKSKAPLRSPQS